MPRNTKRSHVIWALFLVATLSGCKVELHANLQEAEANSMMAALVNRSIAVQKVGGKDGVTLMVEESQFGEAVRTLEALGLPREKYQSVGQVFDAEGLVASPLQEWARLNFAKSQELSQSISTIQGVTNVSVHIAETRKENSFEEVTAPSASVLVKIRENFIYDDLVPQIKQLVSYSIPDIEYENVGVIITPVKEEQSSVQLESVGGLLVHADSAIAIQLLGYFAALMTASTVLLGTKVGLDWFGARREKRKVQIS